MTKISTLSRKLQQYSRVGGAAFALLTTSAIFDQAAGRVVRRGEEWWMDEGWIWEVAGGLDTSSVQWSLES
jgi:hypothetical protein